MATGQTAFERLLTTEARLDSMLSEERSQAAALLQAAQSEAAELERGLETELADAASDVDRRLGTERNARLAFIEDDAERALSRFESVTREDIEKLAGWVVEQVLASIEGGSA